MMFTLAQSYAHCDKVARTQAKNFYVTFLLLDRDQRRAMCAIYAFMRYCDDLSDDPGVVDRAGAMDRWSRDLESALAGRPPAHPIWPAFADAVERFRIPHAYFRDMIAGVRSDLEPRSIANFDQLYDYCYHVASVVGLTIVHIFGFDNPKTLELAETCGVAFQLTNILRDTREDAVNGRVYWPAEDLTRFAVTPDHFLRPNVTPPLRQMLRFQAQRARAYYEQSLPIVDMVHPRSRASMRALIGIYSRLLEKIVEADYDVLSQRIRIPTSEKLWILLKSRFVGSLG
jgi:15-cis-phytoene synthase